MSTTKRRSLSLSELDPLLSVPGVHFVSIQRELRDADAERLKRESRILHLGDELADFADTAAVLALCDLAICVDTSVAHVAGALGRPAFVLLPFQPDWRWMLDRDALAVVSGAQAVPAARDRRLGERHRARACRARRGVPRQTTLSWSTIRKSLSRT